MVSSAGGQGVALFERDGAPRPEASMESFDWDRAGAPQFQHAHAMLARLRNLLRTDHPEVYASILDAGTTEMRLYEDMPGFDPAVGATRNDEEIVMIACRRAALEWAMRGAVQATDGIAGC